MKYLIKVFFYEKNTLSKVANFSKGGAIKCFNQKFYRQTNIEINVSIRVEIRRMGKFKNNVENFST